MTRLRVRARFLLVPLVVVVQGVLAYKFRVFTYLDLPLICTVYYGFTLGNPVASVVIGSSLGLLEDSLSGALLGTNGFSKTLIGFLAASARCKFDVEQAITRTFALFLFTLGDSVIIAILGIMIYPTTNGIFNISIGDWLLTASLNTLLGIFVFGYHERWGNATA